MKFDAERMCFVKPIAKNQVNHKIYRPSSGEMSSGLHRA